MRITETLVTLHTVRTHPGKDIASLREIISEEYRTNERMRFLAEDASCTALRWALEDLHCVVEREGRYFFDSSVRPFSKDDLMNRFIESYLAHEEEKRARKTYDGD